MEDTCKPQECALFGLLGGRPEQCPNYIETWWTAEGAKPKLIKDCAPKRTMLMVQDLYNQQIGLQKAQEQQRNITGELLTMMITNKKRIIHEIKEV